MYHCSDSSLPLPQVPKLAVPPPEVVKEPTIYRVREILDSLRWGSHLEYLVDWEGYGPEKRSWVAWDDVLDPSLFTEFHHNPSDHPASRGRGHPCRHNRASGAPPGGGGTVRDFQSPQSPPPMLTRTQSLITNCQHLA